MGYAQYFDKDIHLPATAIKDISLLLESSDKKIEEKQAPYVGHISVR